MTLFKRRREEAIGKSDIEVARNLEIIMESRLYKIEPEPRNQDYSELNEEIKRLSSDRERLKRERAVKWNYGFLGKIFFY